MPAPPPRASILVYHIRYVKPSQITAGREKLRESESVVENTAPVSVPFTPSVEVICPMLPSAL